MQIWLKSVAILNYTYSVYLFYTRTLNGVLTLTNRVGRTILHKKATITIYVQDWCNCSVLDLKLGGYTVTFLVVLTAIQMKSSKPILFLPQANCGILVYFRIIRDPPSQYLPGSHSPFNR